MAHSFSKFILSPVLGRKCLQPVYEKLHFLSLAGMNYGFSEVEISGELKTIGFAARKLKAIYGPVPLVCFDVGANVGDWSRACLGFFGGNLNLYLFEPLQNTYEILHRKMQKDFSGLIGSRVRLFNLGFSDKKETADVFYDVGGSGLASLYQRKMDHFNRRLDKTSKVALTTVDEFCRDNNVEKIHFMKLDIEGHELAALKGASGLINKGGIDFIQFEFGGANIDSKTFFQDFFYLLGPYYDIYRICRNGLRKISAYSEQYEVFITINYLAVRKRLY
ncbi:MAG: FkbM family methyltransferase [Sedimentisphaerales bacterium]|nr:FkbM family methyltransferase [Sedimentisphaerales bacterium]